MLSTGTIRAVYPVALARASGVTKIPAFASTPTPPVIRPHLLSAQLRGCSCGGQCGPAVLSSYIPPDYGHLRGIAPSSYHAWAWHGLGKGATGAHGSDYNTRWTSNRGLGRYYLGQASDVTSITPDIYSSASSGSGAPVVYTGDPGTPGGTTPGNTITQAIQQATQTINAIPVPSSGSGATSVFNSIAAGASFIPTIGPVVGVAITAVAGLVKALQSWIGRGRQEADLIVPLQNQMTANLGTVTNQILVGQAISTGQLISLYQQVWMMGTAFQEFVLQSRFTDRRASGQALNTLMPYFDGSCGYAVPVGKTAYPTQHNCLTWGDGTLGGPGTDGMLGAIARAIRNAGGQAPVMPDMHQAANNGIQVSSGIPTSAAPIQQGQILAGSDLTTLLSGTGSNTTVLLLLAGAVLLVMMRR